MTKQSLVAFVLIGLFATVSHAQSVEAESTSVAECTSGSFVGFGRDYCESTPLIREMSAELWNIRANHPDTTESEADEALRLLQAQVAVCDMPSEWKVWFLARMVEPEVDELEPAEPEDSCPCEFRGGSRGEHTIAHRVVGGTTTGADCDVTVTVHELTPMQGARAHLYLKAAMQLVRATASEELTVQHVELRRSLRRWNARLTKGRAQYPWELWLNGLRRDSYRVGAGFNMNPLQDQFIFLHPFVGLGFEGFGDDNEFTGQATAVVGFELFGMVRYTNSFQHFLGGSITASVNDLDFSEWRIGGLLHFSHFVSLGFNMLVHGENRGAGTLVISADLAGLAQWVFSPSVDEGDAEAGEAAEAN